MTVTRDEAVDPPPVDETAQQRDYHERAAYFAERRQAYQRLAESSVNNVLEVLRFRLRQPVSASPFETANAFANPTWRDQDGNGIKSGGGIFVVPPFHGSSGELGVVKLHRRHQRLILESIEAPKRHHLYDELLSDAQRAAFQGEIRRAVLELAIAMEVFLKHRVFGDSGTAANVFEALEDKGRIPAKVLELLEIGGLAINGKSFRKFNGQAFTDIDHLFRARNRIAHRGELKFRDDAGRLHTVNRQLLQKWWTSVESFWNWATL